MSYKAANGGAVVHSPIVDAIAESSAFSSELPTTQLTLTAQACELFDDFSTVSSSRDLLV